MCQSLSLHCLSTDRLADENVSTTGVCAVSSATPSNDRLLLGETFSTVKVWGVPGELQIWAENRPTQASDTIDPMRDSVVLFLHAFVTIFRIARAGGDRSVVAESVLLKHQ